MQINFWLSGSLLASSLLLGACGGGGGDDDKPSNTALEAAPAPAPSPAPAPAPAPAPGVSVGQYEALADPATGAALLAQLNEEGGKGYFYLGPQGFSGDARQIYLKEGSTTYTYEFLSAASSRTELTTQANTQGQRGFRYIGNLLALGSSGLTLYRKDNGANVTYTYEALASTGGMGEAAFLSQANAQGTRGFWYAADLALTGATSLYIKDNSTSATYAYEALPTVAARDGFLAQINAQGARGLRLKNTLLLGGQTRNVYVKDNAQAARFTYVALNAANRSADFIAQANAESAAGYRYHSTLGFLPSNTQEIYFKADACTGFMCSSLNPLTQN